MAAANRVDPQPHPHSCDGLTPPDADKVTQLDEARRAHWKANVDPLYLSSIGLFPFCAKVALPWTSNPLGFHGLRKGTKNSGLSLFYNLFKNLPITMLELWMSCQQATHGLIRWLRPQLAR
jgi:hypothetical protein